MYTVGPNQEVTISVPRYYPPCPRFLATLCTPSKRHEGVRGHAFAKASKQDHNKCVPSFYNFRVKEKCPQLVTLQNIIINWFHFLSRFGLQDCGKDHDWDCWDIKQNKTEQIKSMLIMTITLMVKLTLFLSIHKIKWFQTIQLLLQYSSN